MFNSHNEHTLAIYLSETRKGSYYSIIGGIIYR